MAMKFFDPPPVRYYGSKWQIAQWIVQFFPVHDCYVEPYCGGASVYFRKNPAFVDVLNDLNGDVVNFFKVLRTQTDEFIRQIELTPFSRAEYHEAFEPCDDPMESARRFYIRAWQAFGGGGVKEKTGFRTQKNIHRGTSVSKEWQRTRGLWLAAERLRDAIIESDDALTIIKRYDTPKTLFYVDPPYVLKARGRTLERYQHEASDVHHRQLADALHQIEGMAAVSGYPSALYEELYSGWRMASRTNTTNGNSNSVECLWLSPSISNQRLQLL